MNVKITHTLALDDVPKKVNELLQPTRQEMENCLAHLQTLNFLLSSDSDEHVSLSRAHLDIMRKTLTSIDTVLEEAHSMIAGVDDYNMQRVAKEAMEEELVKQEQEREEQLAQELHDQKEVTDDKPF